jgi:hypothetical protein
MEWPFVVESAFSTVLLMVRFGTMMSTRPPATPNGAMQMMPVLPQPVGISTMAGMAGCRLK